MANGLSSLRYWTVNMRMTLQFHSPPDQTLIRFSHRFMEHFQRWVLEVHAGSYSPHKESKTEILFCARPLWTYQDKGTFDDTNMDDITLPNGRFIPVILELRYLGSYITRDGTDTKDVRARIDSAARAFGALSKCIFQSTHVKRSMPNELCNMKDYVCPYASLRMRELVPQSNSL